MKNFKIFVTLLSLATSMAAYGQIMTDNDILNADLDRLLKDNKNRVAGGDISKGLVAYYTFENNCNDVSGMGNNGQTVGSADYAQVMLRGERNNCLALGGLNSPGCVKVNNSSSLQFGDGWTFATFIQIRSTKSMDGWGRTNNSRGGGAIMAKSHDRSGYVIFCGLENGKFSTSLGGALGGVGASIEGVSTNQWVHVAYTYAGGEFRVYLNGKLVTTKAKTANFRSGNGENMYLGKFSDRWYPLHGYLDEVRLYNRALSADEIAAIAEQE